MGLKEPKKKQVELLQQILNVDFMSTNFNKDELNSDIIECEILCDCLQFAYNFGLPDWKIKEFMKFFHQYIKESVAIGMSMEEGIGLLKVKMRMLSETGTFSDFFLKSAVDYFCKTLIQHYHLYVYVLCHERTEDLHVSELVVQAPPYEFTELASSVPHDTWLMEEMIRKKDLELRQHNEDLNQSICETNELLKKELDEYMKTLEDLCPDETTLAELTDLVKHILQKHSDVTATGLNGALERSKQTILCAFEKSKICKSKVVNRGSAGLQLKPEQVNEKRDTSSRKKKRKK